MSALGFVLPAASLGLGSLLLRPRRGFLIKPPNGQAGPSQLFVPQAVVQEKHHDRLAITEHPVEVGAVIADHAYKLPARVMIRCVWSNSPQTGGIFSKAVGIAAAAAGRTVGTAIGVAAAASSTLGGIGAIESALSGNAQNQAKEIYLKLLALQNSRVPFDVYTGKRSYSDMLIEDLSVDTTRETENVLAVVIDCHQIIMVETQTIVVPLNVSALSNPAANMPTADTGARSLAPATNFNDIL